MGPTRKARTVPSLFAESTFASQVVVVTGGGTGIGQAIALELGRLGATVLVIGRRMEPLEETVRLIESDGGAAEAVSLDIRDQEAVDVTVAVLFERHGKIDGLVNNAGGQFAAKSEDISPNGWRSVVDLNLTATFLMSRAVYRAGMHQTGGAMVNIVADMWKGFPLMVHSGAARAGVVNMTKTLAVEWSRSHVRVNAVAPGLIDSAGLGNYGSEGQAKYVKAAKATPAARVGTVAEVSPAVCFLLSPAASYITGETLRVDGGSSLVAPWAPSLEGQEPFPAWGA